MSDAINLAMALISLALPLEDASDTRRDKSPDTVFSADLLEGYSQQLQTLAKGVYSSAVDKAILEGIRIAEQAIKAQAGTSIVAQCTHAFRRSRRLLLKAIGRLARRNYFDLDDNAIYLLKDLRLLRTRAIERLQVLATHAKESPTRSAVPLPRIPLMPANAQGAARPRRVPPITSRTTSG
jgi:hypothetical protein